jgi:hypothetical protein
MRIEPLLLACALACPAPGAGAFDVAGVRSGMSRQEVLVGAARSGLRAEPDGAGNLLVRSPGQASFDAAFVFCGDRLVAYDRVVRAEAEYQALLRGLWSRLGPPVRMDVAGDMGWAMPVAGGFRSAFVMDWFDNGDRIRLRSFVEWETGMRSLHRFLPASIGFATPNPCGLP